MEMNGPAQRCEADPTPPAEGCPALKPNHHKEVQAMRTITALFDSRPDAERAVESMVQRHNLDRSLIQVHAAGAANATAGTHERRDEAHHGFVSPLDALGLPPDDHVSYAEGLRRGGILVSVRAPEDRLDAVADALESNGAVDLDARETDWREGGWTGGGGGLIGGKAAGSSATPTSMPAVNPDAGQAGWTGGGGAIAATAATATRAESDVTHSTYAGLSHIGARATDEDINQPVNAGIASAPPVRPAGPAALAAAGAGASASALRGSGADARRAASEGFEGPGSGAGPAAGGAAAGAQAGPTGGPTGGTSMAADTGSRAPQTSGSTTTGLGRDGTVPAAEEPPRTAKRDASRGGTRVRSYPA